jgi:hypothetical protein
LPRAPRRRRAPQLVRRKLTLQERIEAAKRQGGVPKADLLSGLRAAPDGPTLATKKEVQKASPPPAAGRREAARPSPPRGPGPARPPPRAAPAARGRGPAPPGGRAARRAARPPRRAAPAAPPDRRAAPRNARRAAPQLNRKLELRALKKRAKQGDSGWGDEFAGRAEGVADAVKGFLGGGPTHEWVAQPYRPDGPLEEAALAGALRSAWRDGASVGRLLGRLKGCGRPRARAGGAGGRAASRRGAARRHRREGSGTRCRVRHAAGAPPRPPPRPPHHPNTTQHHHTPPVLPRDGKQGVVEYIKEELLAPATRDSADPAPKKEVLCSKARRPRPARRAPSVCRGGPAAPRAPPPASRALLVTLRFRPQGFEAPLLLELKSSAPDPKRIKVAGGRPLHGGAPPRTGIRSMLQAPGTLPLATLQAAGGASHASARPRRPPGPRRVGSLVFAGRLEATRP